MCGNPVEFLGLTRSAYFEGEYGIHDLYIGVPVKLGQSGIEEIIQITLTDDEQKALQKSADAVKELVAVLKKLK
jgi:malate dehydrogenase